MKAIYLILMVMMGFLINCKEQPCGLNSPPMRSKIIKIFVKPNGTAKKVVVYGTDTTNMYFYRVSPAKNVTISQNRNKIEFEIDKNLPTKKEIGIMSGLLDSNDEYSFEIKVFEGSNTFFEKQVNIKTGMGEKTNECAWDIALTTLEEVTVNDMQYVKKLAKKGVFFISNEAIVLEF